MKSKRLLTVLTVLLFCLAAPLGAYAELTQSEGVYQLSTAADLSEFIDLLADNPASNAVLTQDIDFSNEMYQTKYIATFKGTLNGQGHTLTLAYNGDQKSFIMKLDGGTIKSIRLAGSFETSNAYASGITEEAINGSVIDHVHVSLNLITSTTSSGYIYMYAHYFKTNSNMSNVLFDGTVEFANTRFFTMYGVGTKDTSISLKSILSMPAAFNMPSNASGQYCYPISTTSNRSDELKAESELSLFYKLPDDLDYSKCKPYAAQTGKEANAEALANGKVTYGLNRNQSGTDVAWRQAIGSDAVPRLILTEGVSSADVVYCERVSCGGVAEFTNTQCETDFQSHSMQFHPRVEVTSEADGTESYYTCTNCNTMFSDAEGTNPKESIDTIHYFVDGVCTHHPRIYKEPVKNEEGKYEVRTLNDLLYFTMDSVGQKVQLSKIILMNDIVVNTGVLEGDTLTSDAAKVASFTKWDLPLTNSAYAFHGEFDGGGHTISGLYSVNGQPFIRLGVNSHMHDLTIADSYFYGTKASAFTTYLDGGCTIRNCINRSCVVGTQYAGGFAPQGVGGGSIYNCINYGNISSQQYAGGFIGYVSGGTDLNNCVNHGVIRSFTTSGSSAYCGGLVGHWNGNGHITDCSNYGTIISNGKAGGIGGALLVSDIAYDATNCHNHASVTGLNEVGGLAGTARYITFDRCSNDADIKGNDFVGGFVGRDASYGCRLKASWNSGSVEGVNYVGGLAGSLNSSTVEDCYNVGHVKGTNHVSGIIAFTDSKYDNTLRRVLSLGTVEGTSNVSMISDGVKTSDMSYSVLSPDTMSLPLYVNGTSTQSNIRKCSVDELRNGGLSFLLKKENGWMQNIGVDPYPTLGDKGYYHSRPVAAGAAWGSAVLPFSVESNDSIAYYTITAIDETQGLLTVEPTASVAAKTPFIYCLEGAEMTDVTFVKTNDGFSYYDKRLYSLPVTDGGVTFYATTVDTTIVSTAEKNAFYIADNSVWRANVSTQVPAFRCWFEKEATAAGARQLTIVVGNDDSQATSVLTVGEDGQIAPAVIYDLNGNRLKEPRHGEVNIIDGRKIFIR